MPRVYHFSEQKIAYLREANDHSDELLKYAEGRADATMRNAKLTKDDNLNEVDEMKVCDFIVSRFRAKDGPRHTRRRMQWLNGSSGCSRGLAFLAFGLYKSSQCRRGYCSDAVELHANDIRSTSYMLNSYSF